MPSRSRTQPQPPSPILKHADTTQTPAPAPALPFSACTSSIHSTRVTFPPTPQLASARTTYPPHAYDRTPIVVARNECALPARGARRSPEPATPALTWSSSCSSESDDGADGARTPPADDSGVSTPRAARFTALGLAPAPGAGAFLPHPPSPEREKKRRSATPAARVRRALPAAFTASAFGADDGGCLGGF
jgi:hypothetical protein